MLLLLFVKVKALKFTEIMDFTEISISHFHLWVAFSALTLLVGRQEGHSACKKTEWWGAGMVICLERGAGFHMSQLIPLPLTVSCFGKIQIPDWFYLSGTGSPGQRAAKQVCVCVCVTFICEGFRVLSAAFVRILLFAMCHT